MIHTLEAYVDMPGGWVYPFADLVKRKASLTRDPLNNGRYYIRFPDDPLVKYVRLRKRNQADVTLERERLRWGRVPVLKPVYPFNNAPRSDLDRMEARAARAMEPRPLHKAAAWDMLRQRFADDLAKLGPRINKL